MADWRDQLAGLKGADLTKLTPEAAPKDERGAFGRGVETALRQIPQTAGGAVALGADLVGASKVREFGLGIYEDQSKKIQEISKPSDSFSSVIEGEGSPTEFLKYGAGYVGGQALSAIATGGLGAYVGKKLVQRGITETMAKDVAAKQTARAMGIGAGTTLGGFNLMQEAGSIYPEALEQAKKEGRELDGGDKARVVGAAVGAAAVETAMDMVGLGKVVKGAADGASIGKRALREVPAGMAREGATEGVQTGIERYGAGKPLGGEEATRDYVDSVALGALGGGLAGAAASVRQQKQPEIGPLTGALNAGLEGQAKEIDTVAGKIQEASQSAAGREALAPLAKELIGKTAKAAGVSDQDVESALAGMHSQAERDMQSLRSFAPEQAAATAVGEVAPPARLDGGRDLGLQNRDRSRAASVEQMNKIASNPDYDRLGVGRSPNEAAPMVSVRSNANSIPEADFGREDRVTMGDGSKMGVRYAVVEADRVLASHQADGSERPEYYGEVPDGTIRALNNGRVAALREAYSRGTAEGYRKSFIADAMSHGIDLDSILTKQAPILVRVYDDAENSRPNLGALSNPQSNLGFAASETALNDARVLDLADFQPGESGEFDTPENRPALNRFATAIAAQGGDTAGTMDRGGRFSAAFLQRFKNAVFARAYRNQDLVEVAADAADPDIKNILHALSFAAPDFAKIEEAGDLEMRPKLVDAIMKIRDARARGLRLEEYAAQADLLGQDDLTEELVRFLWANNRAPRRLGEGLKAIAQFIDQELQQRQTIGLFGDNPADIAQVKDRVNKFLEENYGDIQRIEQASTGYPARRASDRAPAQDGGGRRQPAQGQRTEAEDSLLKPYTRAEIEARLAAQEKTSKPQPEPTNEPFVLTGSDSYIDELEARGQMPLFLRISRDFDVAIPRIIRRLVARPDANEQAKEAAKGSLNGLSALIRKGSLLASLGADQIEKSGTMDLIGAKVHGPRDLAALAQVLRDSRFETMRYIFVKDGKIVGHTAVSSRLASATGSLVGETKAEREAFKERMKGLAARSDGYYLLHNHPSGDPFPSPADLRMTKNFAADVGGLLGHVVIDTNAYSVIDGQGKAQFFKEDFGAKAVVRSGVLGETLDNPKAVAALGARFKKPGWVALVATDAELRVNAIMELPAGILADPGAARLKGLISRFGRDHGAATGVFLTGVDRDLDALEPLVKQGNLLDVVSSRGESLRSAGVTADQRAGLLGRSKLNTKVVLDRYLADEAGAIEKKASQIGGVSRDMERRMRAARDLLKCLASGG